MPLADYSHHNEEAAMIWWQEEGKHYDSEPEYDEDMTGFDEEYEDWVDVKPATDEEIERSFDANR